MATFNFNDFNKEQAVESTTDLIVLTAMAQHSAGALEICDIGCGRGHFADVLASQGHSVSGVEPQAHQILKHTKNGAQIHKGGAENLAFEKAQFDIVMFGHSLHHVPQKLLNDALAEALRVLKDGGLLIVTEPLAEGNFYDVMQPVDDEAPLYENVKVALSNLVSSREIEHQSRSYVFGEPSYKTAGHLKSVLVKVDPDRAKAPVEAWNEFNRRFIKQPRSWFFGKRSLKHYSRVDIFNKA